MRRVGLAGLFLAAVAIAAPSAWAISDALKEKGVLYFDENLPQPLTVKLSKATYIHSDRSLKSPSVAFQKGKEVRIVGMAPEGFFISGKHRGGDYTGWVGADVITIDPKVLQQAQAMQQKRDAIELAVKEKRVVEGMTFDHVKESQGKPDTVSFREEKGQRIDTWRYITYERVPTTQTGYTNYGQPVTRTVFVKVPVGEMTIDFRGGLVTGIEQHTQTDIRGSANPTIPSTR